MHHAIAIQRIPNVPGLAVPVLWLSEGSDEASSVLRPLRSLIDYHRAHSSRSMTWMKASARGLGLLFDYLVTHRPWNAEPNDTQAYHDVSSAIRNQFLTHLLRGTIERNGSDDTGLMWLPRTSSAVIAMTRAIDAYVAWVNDKDVDALTRNERIQWDANPNTYNMQNFLFGEQIKRHLRLLSHLTSLTRRRSPGQWDARRGHAVPSRASRGHKRFPLPLLGHYLTLASTPCSSTPNDTPETDYTFVLASMLCALTGTRQSEPLHIWVNDVQLVNGTLFLLLEHPAISTVHDSTLGLITRAHYLRIHSNMNPRHLEDGRFHSGFKGIRLFEKTFAPLYVIPIPGARELLHKTILHYIGNVRPVLMRQRRLMGKPDHPFLLVSRGGKTEEHTSAGDPYTYSCFRQSHRRTISRLRAKGVLDESSFTSNQYSLRGFRHMYGGYLEDIKTPPRVITECLHHGSPLSQLAYTVPTNMAIHNMLTEATTTALYDTPHAEQSCDLQSTLDQFHAFIFGHLQ